MMQFSLLGSGSSGNALLVSTPETRILIDCGLSVRQLQLRAAALGVALDAIDAVFVTHEHGDHCLGLGTLARKSGVPVYATPGTLENLPKKVGELPRATPFEAGESLEIRGMRVGSFSVTHDAADPVGYAIEADGAKLGIACDLGHVTSLVRLQLEGSHALILESNHCPRMLQDSSYPPAIQQRIAGRMGHLSNQNACSLLSSILHERLQLVVLVHISEQNNSPELAVSMATRALNGHPAELHVAPQDRPTRLFTVAT